MKLVYDKYKCVSTFNFYTGNYGLHSNDGCVHIMFGNHYAYFNKIM